MLRIAVRPPVTEVGSDGPHVRLIELDGGTTASRTGERWPSSPALRRQQPAAQAPTAHLADPVTTTALNRYQAEALRLASAGGGVRRETLMEPMWDLEGNRAANADLTGRAGAPATARERAGRVVRPANA
jgi:hypothetical protein